MNKILGVTIALVMCMSGMLAFASSTDAVNDTQHEIPMFVGDSFSYEPSVNLSGTTISASGNALTQNGGFLTFVGGVLSGTATTSGTFSVVITANWTSGSLSQSSTQTITFKIYNHTVITSTSYNTGAVVGEFYEYTLSYTGNGEEVINVLGLPSWLTWNPATKKISGTPQAAHVDTTTNVTLTVVNNVSQDSDTLEMLIRVYNDLAWLSSAPTAVINNTAYTYTASISSVPDVTITKISGPSWLTWNSETKVLSGTPDLTISGEYQDISVTLRASSIVLGKTVDQEISIRVWATLDYVTIPTASLIIAPFGMMMMMTYDGVGATSLMFDINDGSDIIFIGEDEVYDPIYYTFEETGSQMVKLVATNDYGSDTLIVIYDAVGDEEDEGGAVIAPSDNFFEKNWLPIILLIVGILLLLAFAFAVEHIAVPIVAVVMFIIACVLFLCDIGTWQALVDAIRGIFS